MSTHRRAWKQRAGVVVALVAGALLAVPATPALAAPNIGNVSASPSSVEAGNTTKVTYTLTFGDPATPADVQVTSNNSKLTCTDGCSRGRVDKSGTYEATFKLAADLTTNGSAGITIKAVESSGQKDPQEASVTVTLIAKPPPEVQTVKEISGRVTVRANGDPVPGATVMVLDSQQHRYSTTTDGSGNFRFTGSKQKPITPGAIELGASKDTIIGSKRISANAGQTLTGQRISLAIPVEVTPSPTPEVTEEALPTDEETEEVTEETVEATPDQQVAAEQEDSGGSLLPIILGGLFVAIGVGTIVLLWMRRKENADEDDEDDPVGAAGAVPAARGAYRGADDQTRMVSRAGAGPDPTMVGGAALADAPTMMHNRPLVDDVPPDPYGAPPDPYGVPPDPYGAPPDPYGAPPQAYGAAGQQGWAGSGYGDEAPAPGGYGGAGYGNAPASGAGYGNAPASGAGYGNRDYGSPAEAGGAGYPPAQGGGAGYGGQYDEATGRYAEGTQAYPPPADPYATGTYQPPADQGRGYGQEPQQYGRAPEQTGGYGAASSYGAPAGGGYDAGQQGYDGYAQRGGYGSGDGYDQRDGYGSGGGYDQQGGGYGQEPQHGGYDNRAYEQGAQYDDPAQGGRGRSGGQPPQQDRGGRRLDWLDD